VNDVERDFFLTSKGLRHDDSFAPRLFNFVVDVFSKMVIKGASCGMITGLCPHLVPRGVISLQYADDTLLFLENNERNVINLKWTLTCFEKVSGMKINYHKSELMAINMETPEVAPFLDIFQCVVDIFFVKYIGLPLHFDKLRREDLQPLVDSLLSRME
jgi:hypothetical protein